MLSALLSHSCFASQKYFGKVREIKQAQLAFRCTINVCLLTYLLRKTCTLQACEVMFDDLAERIQ